MNGFHVIIRVIPKERGGGFEAVVLEIPGLTVFGFSIEEVKQAVLRRIESWLGVTRRLGWNVKIDYALQHQDETVQELQAVTSA